MSHYNTIPIEKITNNLLRALANECARKGYASKILEREEDSKQVIKVAKLEATFSEGLDSIAMSPFEYQDRTIFFDVHQYTPEGLAKMIVLRRKNEMKERPGKTRFQAQRMKELIVEIESLGGKILYGDSDVLMVRATKEVKAKIMEISEGVNIHFQIQRSERR
jgi:hypothetical protein